MPKPNTQPRKADPAIEMFGDMNKGADPNLDTQGIEESKAAGKQPDAVQELLTKVAALEARITERDSIAERLGSMAPVAAPAAPRAPELDLSGLDPYETEKYQKEVQTRLDRYIKEREEFSHNKAALESQGEQDATTRANQLWRDFSSLYAPYAENEERAEWAIKKATDAARAKGMDLERYATVYRDRFFTDVTTQYDKVFGKPGAEVDVDLGKGPGTETEQDTNRTAGIFSGPGSAGSGAPKGNAAQGDMIAEIHEMQRKSGLY